VYFLQFVLSLVVSTEYKCKYKRLLSIKVKLQVQMACYVSPQHKTLLAHSRSQPEKNSIGLTINCQCIDSLCSHKKFNYHND